MVYELILCGILQLKMQGWVGRVTVCIGENFIYLDSFAQTRLFISCLVIQVDRTDVALGATSIRLQCHSQPWTVPTPPLQSFSLPSSSSDSVPPDFRFQWT